MAVNGSRSCGYSQKMAIFEISEVMKAKLSRLTLTPMADDGGKWSSPILKI